MPAIAASRLVGHSGTATTETVYRKQIRPVLVHGADVMNQIFPSGSGRMLSYSLGYSAPVVDRSAAGRVPCDLVGVAGFEPAASSSRTKRPAKLRHTPPPERHGLPGALAREPPEV